MSVLKLKQRPLFIFRICSILMIIKDLREKIQCNLDETGVFFGSISSKGKCKKHTEFLKISKSDFISAI